MFDLFRFIMLRPPEKGSRDDAIDIGEASDLEHDLEEARNGDAAIKESNPTNRSNAWSRRQLQQRKRKRSGTARGGVLWQ
jgi:hypothetical protein